MDQQPFVRLHADTVTAVTSRLLDRRDETFRERSVTRLRTQEEQASAEVEVSRILEDYLSSLPPGNEDLENRILSLSSSFERRSDEERLLFDAYSALSRQRYREEARRRDPVAIDEISALVTEKLGRLGDLYALTERDWVIEISHVLTEPTCPVAVIRPEGSNVTRFSVASDSIVGAIVDAADRVHAEMIEGRLVEPDWPITNSDDHVWPRHPVPVVDMDDLVALRRAYEAQASALQDARTMLDVERRTRVRCQERLAKLEPETDGGASCS